MSSKYNKIPIFKINSGNVVFYNITFVNGTVTGNTGFGGAINGNCKAINCTFKENHAYSGGAMYGGSAVNCSFVNDSNLDLPENALNLVNQIDKTLFTYLGSVKFSDYDFLFFEGNGGKIKYFLLSPDKII